MYWFMWFIARVTAAAPVPLLVFKCRVLSVLLFDVLRVRRALIVKNIGIAFPDRVRMGRESMFHFVQTPFELLRGCNGRLMEGVTYTNRELLDKVIERGQGVYILSTHTGNFEVMGLSISWFFRKAVVPVKKLGNGGFDRYVHEQRERYTIEPIRRTRKGESFAAIKKAIGEGRPVGFMMDQSRPGEPRLPLFGKPAKTNTSLAAIWSKCPAPMVPAVARRTSFEHYEVTFLPEVPMQEIRSQQDILNQSEAYNRIVEQIIRMCPEQYWWLHDRWK